LTIFLDRMRAPALVARFWPETRRYSRLKAFPQQPYQDIAFDDGRG